MDDSANRFYITVIKLSFTRTFKYEFFEITHPWRTLLYAWNREKWVKWWFFENSVVHNTGYIPSNIDENTSIKVLKQLLDPYSIHCVHHTDVTVLWKKSLFGLWKIEKNENVSILPLILILTIPLYIRKIDHLRPPKPPYYPPTSHQPSCIYPMFYFLKNG